MFQSFALKSFPQKASERLQKLRSRFDDLGIDAFLVPRFDEYRGEFLSEDSERLAWITGFTGSAGIAIILRENAVIFVDGRYVSQVEQEVDTEVFSTKNIAIESLHTWIAHHAPTGLRLGIDPWLHSASAVRLLEMALGKIGGVVIGLSCNPLDSLWEERPMSSMRGIEIQDIAYAGKPAEEKLAEICSEINKKKVAAVVICDPASVAWIFNIRGFDVPRAPYPLARAILYANGKAEIFLDRRKIDKELEGYLSGIALLSEAKMIDSRLTDLACKNKSILIDPAWIPYHLFRIIEQAGGNVFEGSDPSCLLRSVKNTSEIQGMISAHIQDGIAMVYFLSWLDSQNPGEITEIDVVKKLEEYREELGLRMKNPLRDIAFDTISASGANAAIIHYRVDMESNRFLQEGELLLLDSGAQYVNGTTDITRTIAIGDVNDEKKHFFTLVLKGMIAISIARFPQDTRGCDLDSIARLSLWKAGSDFAHGVGHGVGSFLPVHEGPQGISRTNQQSLLPGMVLSNEPGYYRYGDFGIRIENILYVTDPERIDCGDQLMLGFRTLTLCPIDLRLVLVDLLTYEEKKWLNDYHKYVYTTLAPLIDKEKPLKWLLSSTASVPL
ncbi:aminopeptidase P family protein [Candidatus Liberibacter sp.]|uniref:aminopeptidase P family protein n=1 Tax=Candidatus Liberibacter sp. TaxID=34022 RepID=UPI0015F36AE3|nr:aminopeptidase P family protein [Candidatus Liberibacter sp.]MBA5723672.1 aminopeptidase P family protein [Candidatus Liberibacter sp.]